MHVLLCGARLWRSVMQCGRSAGGDRGASSGCCDAVRPGAQVVTGVRCGMQDQEGEGALPLEGSVPDMTATTELFLRLQRAYRVQADAHVAAVAAHARALLKRAGRADGSLPADFVRMLCKNARHLRAVRPPPAARPCAELRSECLRKVRCGRMHACATVLSWRWRGLLNPPCSPYCWDSRHRLPSATRATYGVHACLSPPQLGEPCMRARCSRHRRLAAHACRGLQRRTRATRR
jgi:hypothetical protein